MISVTSSVVGVGTGSPHGGTIIDSGSFRYHVFTASGTFFVNTSRSVTVTAIGGGGGGGGGGSSQGSANIGGGGGGGGKLVTGTRTVPAGYHEVVVGGGGVGQPHGYYSVFSFMFGSASTFGDSASAIYLSAAGGRAGHSGNPQAAAEFAVNDPWYGYQKPSGTGGVGGGSGGGAGGSGTSGTSGAGGVSGNAGNSSGSISGGISGGWTDAAAMIGSGWLSAGAGGASTTWSTNGNGGGGGGGIVVSLSGIAARSGDRGLYDTGVVAGGFGGTGYGAGGGGGPTIYNSSTNFVRGQGGSGAPGIVVVRYAK